MNDVEVKFDFEGKRPTNKQLYELLELGYEQADAWTKDKSKPRPHELATALLNIINSGLNMTAETHEIDYILSAIATYVNTFRFGEKNKRAIFEKTMASISSVLEKDGSINALSLFRILLDHTSKLVK